MVTAQVKTEWEWGIKTINITQPVAPQTTEPPLVIVYVYVVLLGNIKLLLTPSAGAKD